MGLTLQLEWKKTHKGSSRQHASICLVPFERLRICLSGFSFFSCHSRRNKAERWNRSSEEKKSTKSCHYNRSHSTLGRSVLCTKAPMIGSHSEVAAPQPWLQGSRNREVWPWLRLAERSWKKHPGWLSLKKKKHFPCMKTKIVSVGLLDILCFHKFPPPLSRCLLSPAFHHTFPPK